MTDSTLGIDTQCKLSYKRFKGSNLKKLKTQSISTSNPGTNIQAKYKFTNEKVKQYLQHSTINEQIKHLGMYQGICV